jgi:hypothetical protein
VVAEELELREVVRVPVEGDPEQRRLLPDVTSNGSPIE